MEKNLKILAILVMTLATFGVKAQQDPQFTQYFDNTLYINPAYAGIKEMLSITAIHREQYIGVDGRPRSTTFGIHSPLKYESIGLGLTVVNDVIGPMRQTMMYGDVSYSLRFKNNTKLAFGVKAGVNMLNLDNDLLSNGNNPVGVINSFRNRVDPNFGFGILYHGPKFFIGVSTPKLLQTKFKDSDVSLEKRHYFATLGYVARIAEKWKLRPTAQFKVTEGAPFSLDVSLAAIYHDKVWIGAMYRWDAAFGAFLQFQITPQFKAGLASDFGTQKLRKYNSGTFEVMLNYDFKFNKKGVISPRYF